MSSRRFPAAGVNHPESGALTRGTVGPKTPKPKPEAPATPEPSDEAQPDPDYDFHAEARRAAALLSRPLSKQELRRMAMNVVRFAEIKEIASRKRSGPKQGKALRDALHAAEERIKASRKAQQKLVEEYAAGDAALEWIDRTYTGADGKEVIRAGYAMGPREPKMPNAEEARRRMKENLEREQREHPERFLDEAEFAALQERLMPAASSPEQPAVSSAAVAAIISEAKYKARGEEIDSINAARKVAKVKKQTAKRVREHRARKANKQAGGEP